MAYRNTEMARRSRNCSRCHVIKPLEEFDNDFTCHSCANAGGSLVRPVGGQVGGHTVYYSSPARNLHPGTYTSRVNRNWTESTPDAQYDVRGRIRSSTGSTSRSTSSITTFAFSRRICSTCDATLPLSAFPAPTDFNFSCTHCCEIHVCV